MNAWHVAVQTGQVFATTAHLRVFRVRRCSDGQTPLETSRLVVQSSPRTRGAYYGKKSVEETRVDRVGEGPAGGSGLGNVQGWAVNWPWSANL